MTGDRLDLRLKRTLAASSAVAAMTIVTAIWLSLHWMDLSHLCGNQLTYPKNIAACNGYFHRSSPVYGMLTATGAVSGISTAASGFWLFCRWDDRRTKK